MYGWDPRGPEGVEWFESPPEHRVAAAQELLLELGAIKPIQNGLALTELGRKMTALPVHPRLACLLLAASETHLAEHGALVAALLSEKDILKSTQKLRPQYSGDSDIQFRIDLFENWEHRRIDYLSELVDLSSVSRVAAVRDNLLRLISYVGAASRTYGASTEETTELLLLAYPDRVCRRRPHDPTRGVMVGGKGVRIARQSVVHHPELFIAVELEQTDSKGRGEATARLVAGITQEMLRKHFRDRIHTEGFVEWDPKTQNISALRRLSYRDLILNETTDSNPQPEKVRAALFAAVGGHVREWIGKNPSAAKLFLRLEFLRDSLPEKGWPEINDDLLMDLFSAQIYSMGHLPDIVARVDWSNILLDGPLASIKRDLNQMAPTHIQLPSGRSAELEYRSSGPPILRAKVQELFSMADTPRVAAGRVRALLEILGPNYRPVQVTDDLQGFWKRTYQNVRKDLRIAIPNMPGLKIRLLLWQQK